METMKNTNEVAPVKEKIYKDKHHYQILPHIWIFLALVFVLIPLYIMVVTSLMTWTESQSSAFHWWPNEGFSLEAYKVLLSAKIGGTTYFDAFLNTMLMYIPSTLVGILMAALASYGFAKVDFVGNKTLYSLVVILMTFPSGLSLIIQYMIYEGLNWLNTPLPIMVPRMLGSFSVVFFLTQYYRGVPSDLSGTAKIDGLNDWGIFFLIMLPISTPVFWAQFILQFIAGYNDYMGPFLYLTEDSMYTISLVLSRFGDQGGYTTAWNEKMAGCVIGIAPLVILYCCSQRFILKGMAITSGLKG